MAQTKYRDFNIQFATNPANGDIGVLENENAIKQSVKTLVLTNFYERPFQPEKGGNVTSQLFENVGPVEASLIQEQIRTVIQNYEPRVEDVEVDVRLYADSNALQATIKFSTATSTQPIEFDLEITRVL